MDQRLLDKLCKVIGDGEHWEDDYCYVIRNNRLYKKVKLSGKAWNDMVTVSITCTMYTMEQNMDDYEKIS